MKDIEDYIEMLKLSPRYVSIKSLELLPDGIYRCYCSAHVEKIYDNIVFSNNFKIRLENVNIPIFEDDILVFRNFKKIGKELIVNGETFVDRSSKRRVKIENGTILILKGLLTKDGNNMVLTTPKRKLPLIISPEWQDILNKNLRRYIVLRNVTYREGRLILNQSSEVYLER